MQNPERSTRTDADNWKILRDPKNRTLLNESDRPFATSLTNQLNAKESLSAKQWYWVDVLAGRIILHAENYGHKTGKCIYCRRRLTDERSTTVGYGPICATQHGLPWGVK